MDVSLHKDVHEGLEETEDQPVVDLLDVGGVGQIGAHTDKEYLANKRLQIKILSLERMLLELTRL